MDAESKAARAAELGFIYPAFHGTNADLKVFKKSGYSLGIYFGNKAAAGDHYANRAATSSLKNKGEGQVVYPVLLKMTNPKVMDAWDLPRGAKDDRGYLKRIKQAGFDGIIVQNAGPVEQGMGAKDSLYIVFEPNQVRSRFARFDPAKAQSPRIMD